jgi:prepilin-type N-terminal cleavage/methylation domain-containing protein
VRQRNAFTLIELLVVVSIIALLVAILLPSLNEARELALQVRCLATSKQYGTAVLYYLSDYDDYLPMCSTWYEVFQGYLLPIDPDADAAEGKSDIWVCPGDQKRFRTWYQYGSAPYGYCTNTPNVIAVRPPPYYPPEHARPVWNRAPWKMWQIHSPADTMVFGEAIQGNTSGIWSAYCKDSYPGNIDIDTDGDGIIDSHNGV